MKTALQRLQVLGRGSGLKAQLVRGALGVGGLKLLSLPLTLAASILLARGLGPDGYGQYSFVMAVIAMLALPVGTGLGQLITREVALYQHGREWSLFRGLLRCAHHWVVFGSLLIISVMAVVATINSSWNVGDRWVLLFIASLMLPLLGLSALRSSVLRGLNFVFQAQFPDLVVRPFFHLLFAWCLLSFGVLNTSTALGSQIGATAAGFLIGSLILAKYKPQNLRTVTPSYQHAKWAKAVLPFSLLAAIGTFNGQLGILALGWLGTDEEVAALRVAQSGSMLVALSLAIVNMVIGPYITRAYKDGDNDRLQKLYRKSACAALAVSFPIALPLIFFGGPIIHVVYGQAYGDMATWPLAILALGQLVNVAFGSVGLLLTMSGHERDTLNGQITALTVNILAAIILIPILGGVGAALSVALGLLTFNAILACKVVQRLDIGVTVFLFRRSSGAGFR